MECKKLNLLISTLLVFTLFYESSCNPYEKYISVNEDLELSLTVTKQINERGASIINDKYVFLSSCPIIFYNNEQSKISKRGELYFAYDLVPYGLIKKKGENLFYVIKEKDTLTYELLKR